MFFRTFLANIANNLCLVVVYFWTASSVSSYLLSSIVGGITGSYLRMTMLKSLFMFAFVPSCICIEVIYRSLIARFFNTRKKYTQFLKISSLVSRSLKFLVTWMTIFWIVSKIISSWYVSCVSN